MFDNLMQQLNYFIAKRQLHEVDFRSEKDRLFMLASACLAEYAPKKIEEDTNRIQIIDLFSGAGGMSLGFAALNQVLPAFKFLGGCDIDEVSATTYSNNFSTPILNRDLLKIAFDDIEYNRFLTDIKYDKNLPLILIGCAPCQGFSSHRKKRWDLEDERNNLIVAFAEIVKRIKPDCFVMENVPEMLSKKYWCYFEKAKSLFEKEEYTVQQNIHNAAGFGVPQERFRSIIIGMKKGFLLPEEMVSPDRYKTVRHAIGSLPTLNAGQCDEEDWLHRSAEHKKTTIEVIKQVPKDGGNRPIGVGPKCLDKIKGFSDVYGRLKWDSPSITITHYSRNPASGRFVHPEQDRGLTAREAAQLQSFPRGFRFSGKFDDIFRQIGEAVPPLLACGIACNILIELLSSEPTKEQKAKAIKSIENPVSSSYSSVIAGIKHARKRDAV